MLAGDRLRPDLADAGLDVDLDILEETGAEGIGLCRTEHMFFDAERLPAMRSTLGLSGRSRGHGTGADG